MRLSDLVSAEASLDPKASLEKAAKKLLLKHVATASKEVQQLVRDYVSAWNRSHPQSQLKSYDLVSHIKSVLNAYLREVKL